MAGQRDPVLTNATWADVAADFPDLRVLGRRCAVPGAETRPVRRRLAARLARLDQRIDGPRAAATRTHPVPAAYRVLARQVGLDPEADGLPLDDLLLERLRRGVLASRGPVPDACALATLETGVPLWALEASAVSGALRILVEGTGSLWVGDDREALAPLLCAPLEHVAAARDACDVVLFAVCPHAVPAGTVREALWTAAQALEGA